MHKPPVITPKLAKTEPVCINNCNSMAHRLSRKDRF